MVNMKKLSISKPAFSIVGTSVIVTICGIFGFLIPAFNPISIQVIVVGTVFVYCSCLLRPFWESPAIVFGIFMMLNGVIGYLFSASLDKYGGTAAVDISLTDDLRLQTANIFFLSTLIVVGSATIVRTVGYRDHVDHVDPAKGIELAVAGQRVGVVFALFVLGLAVCLNGWSWLMSRSSRFTDDTGSLASLVSMLALAALVMLGIALAGGSRIGKLSALFLIFLYGIYYFSLASRMLTLLPFLVLIGLLIGGSRNKLKRKIALASGFAIIFSPIPLFLRDQSIHGLIPYFQSLEGFKFKIDDLFEAINNVIHGFGIVGNTAFSQPEMPFSSLQISLSLLPGQSSGWYEIAPELRLGFFTPYGALGEVFNQGWIFAVFALTVLGVCFGFIQRTGDSLKGSGFLGVLRFVPLGLMYLLIVQLTQYNLRSEMRLFYYAIVFQIGLVMISKLRAVKPGSAPHIARQMSKAI